MDLAAPQLRRRLMLLLKLGLLALVVWGIHRTLESAWSQLAEHQWRASEVRPAWLVAAGICYLLGQLGPGWFWYRCLRWLGQPVRLGETLRAYYIGHIGKYAPGKAMVIVIRAALLRDSGTTATAASVAVFYETLTTMSVGAACAVLILAARFSEHRWLLAVAAVLWAVVSGPTSPPVFRRLVRWTGAGKLDPAMADRLSHIRYGSLVGCWLEIAGGWLLMGLSLWATLKACNFVSSMSLFDEVVVCTASVAMAVVGGFLSFIPGGIGVREAALLELLKPWFGADGALISAIVSRLVWLVAELVISSILYLTPGRRRGGA